MKGLQFRFLDAGGKMYGEMSGPGEPYQKLVDPERFAPDFPPGVLLGTWWVELLPREAVSTEVKLDVDVRGPAARRGRCPSRSSSRSRRPGAFRRGRATRPRSARRHRRSWGNSSGRPQAFGPGGGRGAAGAEPGPAAQAGGRAACP